MAEPVDNPIITPQAQPRREEPGLGNGMDLRSPIGVGRQFAEAWHGNTGVQALQRSWASSNEKDPNFVKWRGLEGYEDYADHLLDADSQEEQDAIKAMINRNRIAEENVYRGPMWGWAAHLAAGVADPLNLIPIPAVKGVGFLRGAIEGGGIMAAVGAGSELVREAADPTARQEDFFANVTLSTLIGAGISGGAGAWGARARPNAVRRFEAGLGVDNSPNLAIELRDVDVGGTIDYRRIRRKADGSRPFVETVENPGDYVPKDLDGERYVYQDGYGWTAHHDLNAPNPSILSDELSEALGAPERAPFRERVVDDARVNKHFEDGQWQDEFMRYLPEDDATPIESIVLNGKDMQNFFLRKHLWEEKLPRKAGETIEDWNVRTGRQAMQEFRASKVDGTYSAPAKFIAWALDHTNFSPWGNAVRASGNDPYVADLMSRVMGDSAFAVKANDFGHAMPQSVYVNGQNHVVAFREWEAKMLQQWVRLVEGSQTATGKEFMRQNVTAAAYSKMRGARKIAGSNELDFGTFQRMIGQAVFDPGEFSIDGFKVNPQARAAAKELSLLLKTYESEMRGAGMFKDQKQLTKEMGRWQKKATGLKRGLTKWVFGQTGEPAAYQHAVRVKGAPDRFFSYGEWGDLDHDAKADMLDEMAALRWRGKTYTGERHADLIENLITEFPEAEAAIDANPDQYLGFMIKGKGEQVFVGETDDDAIDAMIEALGEEGVLLAEQLTDQDYGWSPRARAAAAADTGFVPAGEAAVDATFYGFSTTGEALDHIARTTANASYKEIIQRIRSYVDDVGFTVHDDLAAEPTMQENRGLYRSLGGDDGGTVHIRGEGIDGTPGTTADIVLHEAVHAASFNRLRQGRSEGAATPLGKAAAQMDELHALLRDRFQEDPDFLDYKTSTADEILAYGLTDRKFQDWMRQTKLGKTETVWSRFITVMRNLLGIGESEHDALSRLIEITDEILPDEGAPSVRAAGAEADARFAGEAGRVDEAFVSADDMLNQRVKGLSPKQKAIYDEMRTALDMVEANMAQVEEDLKFATDSPHVFRNQNGEPENYWARYFLKDKMAGEQDKVKWLFAQWYEHDGNHTSAESNAAKTVDNILQGDIGDAHQSGSPRVLNQRALNIPNSFKATHPEWGEIRMADYINLNAAQVAQNYIHQVGNRLEAAKMFGDAEFKQAKVDLRAHLLEKIYDKQTTDSGREAAMATIQQIEGEFDLATQAVYNTLKDRDPAAIDNVAAGMMKNFATLTGMGKAVINNISDIAHSGMAAGYSTWFKSLFTRFLGDMEKIGPELKSQGHIVDLWDMAQTHYNLQEHAAEHGMPSVNGNMVAKWMHDRIPGFYKLTGLTPATVGLKSMMGFAAGDNIIRDAIRIAGIVEGGGLPGKKDIMRLAALGINARDAVTISKMPFETAPNGLYLPAVHKWQGLDGQRARALVLNAQQREMRRGVSTPGLTDSPLMFRGVWTWKGRKTGIESDLLTIPMQFMSYSMGAWNKIIASGLQGRDRSTAQGIFWMIMGGFMIGYLKSTPEQWRRKTLEEKTFDALETSGLAGFWFGDINRQIEKASNGRFGARPALGIKTFKKGGDIEAILSTLGAAPSTMVDIGRPFYDAKVAAGSVGSAMKKAVPYNNVLWWDRFAQSLVGETTDVIGGRR